MDLIILNLIKNRYKLMGILQQFLKLFIIVKKIQTNKLN
jgi:hypothetical protein